MSNGSKKSPWKKAGVNINKVLGSNKAARLAKERKLNKLVDEYVDRVKWNKEKPEVVQKDLKEKFKEAEK